MTMNSAQRIQPDLAPAPPPDAEWIDIAEAARRAGVSSRAMHKRIPRYLTRRMAKSEPPPDGGKPRWLIYVGADVKFVRVDAEVPVPFDILTLTGQQRGLLIQREAILLEWRAACRASDARTERQATAAFLEQLKIDRGMTLSHRTLQFWRDAYRASGRAGLVDGRWLKAEPPERDKKFVDDLRGAFLKKSKPSRRSAWFWACSEAEKDGRPAMEYRTACRILAAIPKSVVMKFREREEVYKAKCNPSIERDYTTLHTNEQWVGDHHQLDVIVNHNGTLLRPWLTAWMDMRSRRIVGWCIYAHAPNQNAIISALRGGCESFGVPELLYMDNGKDFDSYALHGRTKWQRRRGQVRLEKDQLDSILASLGCKSRFCWTYHGQSKPIERWFGTLEDQFGKLQPTYCGNKPENKPDDLAARLKKGLAPKLADFIVDFAAWLECYHSAPHSGNGLDGLTPVQAFDAGWNGAARRVASPELLAMLLMRTAPARVGKNGIRWKGLTYGRNDPAIFPEWLGQDVYLRVDERDVTRVQVWTQGDRFLCLAKVNQLIPANATDQELREAIAGNKADARKDREYIERRPRLYQDLGERMYEARMADNKRRHAETPDASGPGSIVPVRNAVADQLSEVQAAQQQDQQQLRPAVGAEFTSAWDKMRKVYGEDRSEPASQPGGFFYPESEWTWMEPVEPEPEASVLDPFKILGQTLEKLTEDE